MAQDLPKFPEAVQEPAPEPVKVSSEDRLRAENLQLRMQNVQLQLQIMQADLQKALQERNGIATEMGEFRQQFQQKYGADLAAVQITKDGTILPVKPTSGT